MAEFELFDKEIRNGKLVETFIDDKGTIIERKSQDVDPYLRANRARANAYGGERSGDHFVLAASVPPIIYLKWLDEGVDMLDPNCHDEVNRRLNSSEWSFLRTDPRNL